MTAHMHTNKQEAQVGVKCRTKALRLLATEFVSTQASDRHWSKHVTTLAHKGLSLNKTGKSWQDFADKQLFSNSSILNIQEHAKLLSII